MSKFFKLIVFGQVLVDFDSFGQILALAVAQILVEFLNSITLKL
jgi:hypothetical protein